MQPGQTVALVGGMMALTTISMSISVPLILKRGSEDEGYISSVRGTNIPCFDLVDQ
jgi:hypothetical protein